MFLVKSKPEQKYYETCHYIVKARKNHFHKSCKVSGTRYNSSATFISGITGEINVRKYGVIVI